MPYRPVAHCHRVACPARGLTPQPPETGRELADRQRLGGGGSAAGEPPTALRLGRGVVELVVVIEA
jgi:hypothetical protein